jgi:hypothetical protein
MLFIFSTPVLIRHLWQLKTVVFLHWCIICSVLLAQVNCDISAQYFTLMLSDFMLSVVMCRFIMLSVILLIVIVRSVIILNIVTVRVILQTVIVLTIIL